MSITSEQLDALGRWATQSPVPLVKIATEYKALQQRIAALEADRDCRTNGGFLSNDLDCDRGTLALCATHKVAALEGRIAKLEALNQRLHRQVVKALLALTPEQALAEEEP